MIMSDYAKMQKIREILPMPGIEPRTPSTPLRNASGINGAPDQSKFHSGEMYRVRPPEDI